VRKAVTDDPLPPATSVPVRQVVENVPVVAEPPVVVAPRIRQAVVIAEPPPVPIAPTLDHAIGAFSDALGAPADHRGPAAAPTRRISAKELAALRGATARDDWFDTVCPAHPDISPSLSFTARRGGGITFYCHAGCSPIAVERAMAEALGVDVAALAPLRMVATYDYTDAHGVLLWTSPGLVDTAVKGL
jgi:hypothetical protein